MAQAETVADFPGYLSEAVVQLYLTDARFTAVVKGMEALMLSAYGPRVSAAELTLAVPLAAWLVNRRATREAMRRVDVIRETPEGGKG